MEYVALIAFIALVISWMALPATAEHRHERAITLPRGAAARA